jgi:GT2 family glycosyltransferase
MTASPPTLLISILSLGRPDNVLRQMEDLPGWLAKFSARTLVPCHIVVRNNNPTIAFAEVAARLAEIDAAFPLLRCTLVTDVPNNGFGGGHNSNMALSPATYVLILNDDIGFPHLQWLDEAFRKLEDDPKLACVAGEENPKNLSPIFGNGLLPGAAHLHALPYGEASILLCRHAALERVGFFHADYAWAMCEDADLSLRLQQAGYRIAYISMPHQHWRSTSFNSLPGPVKSSILEHNRAALFANWRDSFATGEVGRFEVFDLWSDGLGDVLCALPHVLARLAPLSQAQRRDIIINTSHPELIELADLAGIRVTSVADLAQLRTQLRIEGLTILRSMRLVNFSLPFNIHALLAGTLGVEAADKPARDKLTALLRGLRVPAAAAQMGKGACVLHTEFARDHEGRGLSPAMASSLLGLCAEMFSQVVLVGKERRLSARMCGAHAAKIIDLQGNLSLAQLAAVIAHGSYFVGIDSLPAHLAQAAAVPAAVVFGAVHPLARAWATRLLWPITAELDCIGCYHTQLEPSVPFCMRRDQACMSSLNRSRLEATLRAMMSETPHDWSAEEGRLHGLQARLMRLIRFHPAPPERLFRPQAVPNEQISNLIYRMTEQMSDLLRDQYQASAIKQLRGQVHDLEAELFQQRIEAEARARLLPAAAPDVPGAPAPGPRGTRILKLSQLRLLPTRCRVEVCDQWLEVVADDDDPQLLLPPLTTTGKVQLRLSCILAVGDSLQVYWASGDDGFTNDNVRTVEGDAEPVSVSLVFDARQDAPLRIRIDPTTGLGAARLHGSLGGSFVLAESPALPKGMPDASAAETILVKPASEPPDGVLVPLQVRPPSRGASRRHAPA